MACDGWGPGAFGAEVRDNVVYSNYFGIRISRHDDEGIAERNRVFDNSIGIWAEYGDPRIVGNFIYSNSLGIQVAHNSSYQQAAEIANNLLYDNRNGGILVVRGVNVGLNNDPPQWNPMANRTVPEGVPAQITLVANDPEQGPLAYELIGTIPAGASIDLTTGVFHWTPTESQGPGTYTISVRATDDGAPPLSATTSFTIMVREANATPTLDGIADKSIAVGAALNFPVVAADSDIPVNALTFSLTAGAPTGAAIDMFTGAFSWTPTESQIGNHSVTVHVVDDGSPPRATTATFLVTVVLSNTPPTISGLTGRTILEDQSLAPVSFTVSDGQTAAGDLVVTATSDNSSLVPNANITLGGSGGNRTIAVQPLANRNGSAAITVTVSDGVHTVSDTFVLAVTAVNDAPVLGAIEAKSVLLGRLLTFTVSATDVDTPPHLLTLSLDAASVGLGMTLDSSTGVFHWLPTASHRPGDYEVTMTVTDDGVPAASDARTFTITVVSWQNPRHPCDVSDDGYIAAIDVLMLINDINSKGFRNLLSASPLTPNPPPFLDPNGDGEITAADVLTVINYINSRGAGSILPAPGAEGENVEQSGIGASIPISGRDAAESIFSADSVDGLWEARQMTGSSQPAAFCVPIEATAAATTPAQTRLQRFLKGAVPLKPAVSSRWWADLARWPDAKAEFSVETLELEEVISAIAAELSHRG